MSVLAVALASSLALTAAPHFIALHRTAPTTGAAVWLLALLLRALVAVGVATLVFARLAHTGVLEAALHWCWHDVLPDVPGWLGFAEHPVAHAVVAVPLFAIATALLTHSWRGLRAWLGLRRALTCASPVGPERAVVVPGDDVVLAVPRLGRGRVVVSDRTLRVMDDEELAAGMAHELAHLRRRHRPLLLLASMLATIGRPLPGTVTAQRELGFQLERDADAWAVQRIRDPLSLASAICKVAGAGAPPGTASLAGRGPVTRRLAELVGEPSARSAPVELAARALALALTAAVLASAVAAPAWAVALGDAGAGHICSHG